MRRSVLLAQLMAVTVLISALTAGAICHDGNDVPASQTTVGATISPGISVSQSNFEIEYSLRDALSGRSGLFVWRQAAGWRRWDSIYDDTETTGYFVLDTMSDQRPEPDIDRLYCQWIRTPDGPSFTTNCGSGARSGGQIDNVVDALESDIETASTAATILGRSASCHRYDSGVSRGMICVDDEMLPLRITIECGATDCLVIEADAIRSYTLDVGLPPISLTFNEIAGIWQGEEILSIEQLNLPARGVAGLGE